MRVHVVSDVHGNSDALASAARGADALVVLGDLLDFVDYDEPTHGILADILGPGATTEFARLRSEGGPGALREFTQSLWADVDDPRGRVDEAVRKQYGRMFAALGAVEVPVWLMPGNVDVPAMWPEFLGAYPHVVPVDGDVVEIGDSRVGFVGGVPLPPGVEPRAGVFRSYMRGADEFTAAVEALGEVDVLCSHAPPAVAELAYDVVARTHELTSPALLDRIRATRPRLALYGHVHAPLTARTRIGPTECVNVGHFRRRGTPAVARW
ncbi:metallophosphoesterase family protein [Actinomycetospora termitidis]|uniref:Metallophosphoesterase n=1 Tax=Actinomycetospora termitidis TaxID=3053470 RepID=A0ABT7M847_9PSEU|nr:metallophosphoesterase [Actinomycetospora sp. Odt1-22]MDL5156850.1 metallophosphoesterase [Actinomycetospora sp. Odt1-22]